MNKYIQSRYSWFGDLGIDYADSGAWRSYELEVSGDSRSELLKNANISEIDQDGGDLRNYGIDDCGSEVYDAVMIVIDGLIKDESEIDREMFERQHKEAGEL